MQVCNTSLLFLCLFAICKLRLLESAVVFRKQQCEVAKCHRLKNTCFTIPTESKEISRQTKGSYTARGVTLVPGFFRN